jgi:Tfp pilus assembly protein PilN
VAPGVAELTIHHDGQPRALRHLRAPAAVGAGTGAVAATAPSGGAAVAGGADMPPESPRGGGDAGAALTPELRQVLSLVPQNGTAAPTELVVWDGIGLGDSAQRWGDVLHVAIRQQSLDSLGVTVAPDAGGDGTSAPTGGRYAAAVALALEGLSSGGPTTDLLHSRLVPKKEARVGRWTVWAVVLGVTLVASVAFALFDLSSKRRDVADLKAHLKKIQPELDEAKASIARTTFAQRWTGTDPKALSLMRDVTVAFPEGGRVWATSLTLLPDGRVTLGGRATSDGAPLDLLKRLRDSGKFSEVQLGGTQPGGRGSNEVQFTINFRYPGITGSN